jgi:hypothetical protein
MLKKNLREGEKMAEVRNYALRTSRSGKEIGTYKGRSPRQAALKAMKDRRVKGEIYLREKGRRYADNKRRLHHFTGKVVSQKAPAGAPSWLGSNIKVARVKKVGVELM